MNIDVYNKVYSILLQRIAGYFPSKICLKFSISDIGEILIRHHNDQFTLRLYNDSYECICIYGSNLAMLDPDSMLFKKHVVDIILENAKESDIFIKYYDFDYILVNKGETLESLAIQADLES